MTYQERLFRQRHGCHCEPTSIAMAALAISAAGSAASLKGQHDAAKAQGKYQQELAVANNSVAGEQMSQLRIQQAQSAEATARENERARLANQGAKSSAIVSAGETGVTGSSVDALLQEFSMHEGRFKESTLRQKQLNDQGITAQIDAVKTGARYQNLQINAPITGPNYLAEGLRLGKDAVGIYGDYKAGNFGSSSPKPKKV